MRLEISRDVLVGIRSEVAAAHPEEACGLLFGDAEHISAWQASPNVAKNRDTEFEIDPTRLFAALRAERDGGPQLIGYWHSHPNGDVEPSPRDLDAAEDESKIWVIIAGDDIAAWRLSKTAMIGRPVDELVVRDGEIVSIQRLSWNVEPSKRFSHIPLKTGEVRHLVPRRKSDLDLIPMIAEAGYPAIAPILDDLMTWTADPNWPICAPLVDYLATLGEPMVEPIRLVLRGTDGGQKMVCLRGIVAELPPTARTRLRDDVRRLAEQPSEDDRAKEVDVEARKILAALDE
jgi:proteasome lid subunit RPN8/RPN11